MRVNAASTANRLWSLLLYHLKLDDDKWRRVDDYCRLLFPNDVKYGKPTQTARGRVRAALKRLTAPGSAPDGKGPKVEYRAPSFGRAHLYRLSRSSLRSLARKAIRQQGQQGQAPEEV